MESLMHTSKYMYDLKEIDGDGLNPSSHQLIVEDNECYLNPAQIEYVR